MIQFYILSLLKLILHLNFLIFVSKYLCCFSIAIISK